ncbi:MAG: serine hydrolase [Gemmatimonas sp.]|nr:serine hydrolase [Gemmatimonas sp.]
MTRTLIGTLLICLLHPAVAASQQDALTSASPDARVAAAPLQEATGLLSQYVAEGRIAGAVAAIARDGQLAYFESVGYQDLEAQTPMTAQSLFRIYSMTKPVTAVAVMMLNQEGHFQLSDPVSTYLPEFDDVRVLSGSDGRLRPPVRPITIQDLLLHTSGLSHRTSELYRQDGVRSRTDDLPTFVSKIVRSPLMEDPGGRFRYSEATTVLGRLVEVWSGQRLDDFMEERIFRPLGMIDTGFSVDATQASQLATVYRSGAGPLTPVEIEEIPFTEVPALLEGAVGLVSTVPEATVDPGFLD